MRPVQFEAIGDLFVVVWDDGHESYYPLEALRRGCPCAICAGEPDLFGRMLGGGPQRYTVASFQMQSIEPIGNYALQPNWADGHSYGIWTFERLRSFCPCGECGEKPEV
ncbi:MAG: DUF971 domain-containing protein [Thermoanaerobaculia bacterium]